ncbi:hypothetical protein [Gluconobacter potus]|uniref:hypothetical protein n=1 Tax=Gluconobacter potus TaxID=2724927 RepID=UPI0039ED5A3A
MTETHPTLRLWFMDWHGGMLDHDPLKDAPTRTPFQPGRLPGLCAIVPPAFQFPCRPFMEKRVSMPRAFPEMEMQELPHNRVAFFLPRHKTYLISVPFGSGLVDYYSPAQKEWETFLPLTLEMLRGLSLLITPDTLKLEDDTGEYLPTPTLHEQMTLRFGERNLPLFLNTDALTRIGQIMPGTTASIDLTWQIDSAPAPLAVHRQTAPTPEPATL